jgi:hypothetical protein
MNIISSGNQTRVDIKTKIISVTIKDLSCRIYNRITSPCYLGRVTTLVAKQVADMLTGLRWVIVLWLMWLGWEQGAAGLRLAVWSLITSWTTDALDGPIARRSRVYYHSWLGDHDLEVDMAVSIGLLIYMLQAGFVDLGIGAAYLLTWVLIFWHWGIQRPLGMIIQAPIYGWFIWVSMNQVPETGIWVIAWILITVILTWPRFPNDVIPGFLLGLRSIKNQNNQPDN